MKDASTEITSTLKAIHTQHQEKQEFVHLVRKWGGMTSDAVLDPQCKIFFEKGIEGFIGYRLEGTCAIAFGDPVCAPQHTSVLAEGFRRYCEKLGWTVIYLAASTDFAEWALKHVCKAAIEFGSELFIDPRHDPRNHTGVHASLVRRKVRHATHEGVIVKEYMGRDEHLEQAIVNVGEQWLKSRRKPQIYISHVRLFEDRPGKRWFYAQRSDQIIGVVVLNQLQKYHGWLLNRLMMTPDASHGTPELLVVSALEAVGKENCPFVTFGSISSGRLGAITGFSTFSTYLTKFSFNIANMVFHLGGHEKFWDKFHPTSRPSYLLFDSSHLNLHKIISLMRALNVNI